MNEEIINSALSLRMNDLNSRENVIILANAYRELFGREICVTCSGDIRQAYYKINAHLKNPNVMKLQGQKANKYKLKTGVIIIHPETNAMYSNINLTDEVAEEILSMIPSAVTRFDQIPAKISSYEEPSKTKTTEVKQKSNKQKLIIESLQSMTLKELKEIAKERKYPKKEWNSLNKKSIIEYLIGK